MTRPAILTLMRQQVEHAPFLGRNSSGQPFFDAPVVRRARVEHRSRLVRSRDGVERLSTTQAYIEGAVMISEQDKITLPDGTSPTILAVANQPDLDGQLSHCEVAF